MRSLSLSHKHTRAHTHASQHWLQCKHEDPYVVTAPAIATQVSLMVRADMLAPALSFSEAVALRAADAVHTRSLDRHLVGRTVEVDGLHGARALRLNGKRGVVCALDSRRARLHVELHFVGERGEVRAARKWLRPEHALVVRASTDQTSQPLASLAPPRPARKHGSLSSAHQSQDRSDHQAHGAQEAHEAGGVRSTSDEEEEDACKEEEEEASV